MPFHVVDNNTGALIPLHITLDTSNTFVVDVSASGNGALAVFLQDANSGEFVPFLVVDNHDGTYSPVVSVSGLAGSGDFVTQSELDTHAADTTSVHGITDTSALVVNPMTTKGDLIVGGVSGAVSRLGVGASGQILTADSTASLGVKWSNAGSSGAPTDADYWVETANSNLSAEVVVGTTGITTTAYASRQAAAKAGRLFLPSDGFELDRDTGSAWSSWGPIFPFTAPVSGDFAWINQGSASIDTTHGGVILVAPALSGSSIKIRKKAAPSTPYTITAFMIPTVMKVAYASYGLVFRQSSDGKLAALTIYSDATSINYASQKYSGATPPAFVANYATGTLHEFPRWLRIADNGTNRILSISYDGVVFIPLHTIGRTDYLTADEVGFFADANQATFDSAVTLLSWKAA